MDTLLGKRTVSLDKRDGGKVDKRRFNKGASQRRSYTNEEKLAVIKMKDSGLSYDAIAEKTGYSRVNMEKWCSQKGREVIFAKAKKWASGGQSYTGTDPVGRTVAGTQSENAGDTQRLVRSVSTETESENGTAHAVIDDNESSDDEGPPCTGGEQKMDTAANHVLSFVAREECKERMLRRSQRQQQVTTTAEIRTSTATATTDETAAHTTPAPLRPVGAPRASRDPNTLRRPLTVAPAPAPAHVKYDRRAPIFKEVDNNKVVWNFPEDLNDRREFVKKTMTENASSDITMTISDTMLKMDYFAAPVPRPAPLTAGVATALPSNGAPSVLLNMTTSVQATRPIVANTKFFQAINGYRKKKRAESGMHTRARVLEERNLSDDDSEQEREDSEMMLLLGE